MMRGGMKESLSKEEQAKLGCGTNGNQEDSGEKASRQRASTGEDRRT